MKEAEEIEDFRRRLVRAFPPHQYYGLVSTHDECDDGIHLRKELHGKRWEELLPEVLFHGSIALPLLEPDALVAFLPAWILRSMQTFSKDSIVLEFTLYFLCPGSADEGWDEKRIAELTSLFDPAQKRLIQDLLRAVLSDASLEVWRPYADFGFKWWGTNSTPDAEQNKCD